MKTNMKVLITGAAGFIGTHLVKYCLEQGHQVLAVDNRWDNHHHELWTLRQKEFIWISGDIRDEGHMDQVFEEFKPDVCFHLAAYASEGRSNHIRSFIHYNNTVGTANVINACVNHKCKLVFTSSVAVMSGPGPYNECMRPDPIDSYGLSKWMSELEIKIASDVQDLQYCIIRPRNVMGPGQNLFDPSRNLWGIWMYNALNNKPCLIYGDGENQRDFTYIDDLIAALYKAKDLHGYTINVGSGVGYSLNEAADIFKRVTGYKNFQHVQKRHEVAVAHCDTGLAKEVLGYKDTISLIEGVRRMWAWAKTVPMRPLDQMPPLEVTTGAHSSLK